MDGLRWDRTRIVLYFLAFITVVEGWKTHSYRGDPWSVQGPMAVVCLMALLMLPSVAVLDFVVFLLRWDLYGLPANRTRR